MDSDPDIEIIDKIDKDSGMVMKEKPHGSISDVTVFIPFVSFQASKDETPERKVESLPPASNRNDEDNEYDDEPDETLGERLWGLTEMFPDPVRNTTAAVSGFTVKSVKGLYRLTCNASWIFFTSSMILFAPVIFEVERAQVEEMQKSQQKQMLLGTGGSSGGMPSMPQM